MSPHTWHAQLAQKLAEKRTERPLTIASGLSPSGPIHVGNLREILTSTLVYDSLQDQGIESELILSWDDYDRFRKVPANIVTGMRSYSYCCT